MDVQHHSTEASLCEGKLAVMLLKYKGRILLYGAGVIGTGLFSMRFGFGVSVKNINIEVNRRQSFTLVAQVKFLQVAMVSR